MRQLRTNETYFRPCSGARAMIKRLLKKVPQPL